ncbi:GCN5-related N-acetyltransferase [Parvibaculum lavamentivorans DS-1]|uniref:GCN5-related N-acetyltransferase n=1 Tax=Parvibaculum lavamentivorans (strain DS-1 / DSM 13023 / NCIMB 13966) TaxID=402881 RepID=A7HRP8_PARL1|nr:GNAT family N-acetyltransferase [Parvibaculum lavamentivorans]ABS62581.1 GCN5-related N-acetyltransferase [Parvibaculum lavamentivorans DS-1]
MPEIRPVRPADLDALYDIALKTGAGGTDATALHEDPRLIGHVYAAPYAVLAPECALVVEDAEGVGGYIVGAVDTHAFADEQEKNWWPKLRGLYPKPSPPATRWSPDETYRYLIHHPHKTPDRIVAAHPSHLHINLLPRLQGRGLGRALMDSWLPRMAALGSSGVHLGVAAVNERGQAFYRAYGFRELERASKPSGTIWFGMSLKPAAP